MVPPVTVEPIAHHIECSWTPQQVLLGLAASDEPGIVALVGAWFDGGAVIASRPTVVIADPATEDLFEVLDRRPTLTGPPTPVGVHGGWIGCLGYQAGGLVERLPAPPDRPQPLPRWHLGWYDHVLRRDVAGRWWFEALVDPANQERIAARHHALAELLAGTPPPAPSVEVTEFHATPTGSDHRKAVRRALELIVSGDIYQANVCLRLDADLVRGRPVDLFVHGSARLHPRYGAFVDLGRGRAVSSMSPEQFLRRVGTTVSTAPIKGTRPRPSGSVDGCGLQSSEKDRAENLMIVDLMRNDLGRVCLPGSIQVPRLFDVEAHPGVWHLVSEVTGELHPAIGDGGLVRAAFPPGSVTGAPKVRAMQVIAEIEATAREVYTGAIGMVSPTAGADWNVAIRTFEHHEHRVWLGVGGGIVAESDPDAELAECVTKAEPLVAALGSSIAPLDPVVTESG